MQPRIRAQLVQNEFRNVLSRYRSAVESGEIRERPDLVAAGFVVEDCGTNQNPIEPAISDDAFLPVLVGVDLTQKQREDHLVENEAAVAGAVAGADAGDADE